MELSNQEILDKLNEKVYGHINAKKAIISAMKRSQLRWKQYQSGMAAHSLIEIKNLLLIGDSGTGKTAAVAEAASIMKIPFMTLDATELNHTGASDGVKVGDIVKKINKFVTNYKKSTPQYATEMAVREQMVIFVDEFDKLSGHLDGSSRAWNKGLQAMFLKLFENSLEFKSITWIFAGVFPDIKKHKINKPLGFTPTKQEEQQEVVTDQDLIDYGVIAELVGRLSNIVQLDKLVREDYLKILKEQTLPKKIKELSFLGYENVHVSDEEMQVIVDKSIKSQQGVRSLKRELDKLFVEHEWGFETTKKYKDEVQQLKNIKSLTSEWTEQDWECFNYGMEKY